MSGAAPSCMRRCAGSRNKLQRKISFICPKSQDKKPAGCYVKQENQTGPPPPSGRQGRSPFGFRRFGIMSQNGASSMNLEGYSEKELIRMARKWLPRDRVPKRIRVKDTADFFRVDYDDVVYLKETPYLVRNNEREGRFGLEDEQKFWVKRARNLLTGDVKILKWVFRERFDAKIGNLVFECVRSPRKEA